MSRLRVGLAGCGLVAGLPRDGVPIATNHAQSARSMDGVDLVAAADPDRERRDTFQRYWRVPSVHSTVAGMLAEQAIDVLVVAAPPDHHAEICELALRSGVRGILCEKPFTGNAKEASRIVEACDKASVPIAVNFMRRWDTSHRRAVETVRRELGTVRAAFGTYTGTLRGNGSHMVDLLKMLVSDPWTIRHVSRLAGENDGPVAMVAEAGATMLHMNPIVGADYFVFELIVLGTGGRVRFLQSGNDIRIDRPKPSASYPGYCYLEEDEALPSNTLPDAFGRALGAVVAAVRDGVELPVPAAAHLETLAAVDLLVDLASRPPGDDE